MIEAWWICRWYFLYISASVMLPNFRSTCHAGYRCFMISVNSSLLESIESIGIYWNLRETMEPI
ncbi:hypothetical protein Hanom_Chr07g00588231 [Helianthus anomalus]